ncbi:type II secretion system F family protein [Acetobacter fallax]|uniref:Type II secretion system protein GspF domain-containing protein n=1 Tax=Acetobacter fallax TaxID=1737473 RepID=A0ABX0KF95_9PROT|nr:type II secretion system F family protein [Acetobacter fallax]NHO33628.1 hypothetical protein [Acetobacter fallax]NHO37215.1 hypothetical protein [Acetobacter fallax]
MSGLFGLECGLIIIVLCIVVAFKEFVAEKNYNRTRSNRISVVAGHESNIEIDHPASILTPPKNKNKYIYLLKNVVGFDFHSTLYTKKDIYKVCSVVFFAVTLVSFVLAHFLDRLAVEFSPIESLAIIRIYFSRLQAKHNSKLIEQLPETVSMMARCLKVGVSLSRTLEIVAKQAQAPTKNLFQDVIHKVAVGKELGEALEDLALNGGIKEYRFFSIIVRLQTRTGGGLAEILDSFASTIRKRTQARKKALALASEARTSCYVLAGLPIFMSVLMLFMNPKYIEILYTTPSGLKMLYTAILLFIMGISSMLIITKLALR